MKLAVAALILLLPLSVRAEEPSPEAQATVVIYNRNDSSSRNLAKYYAEKRNIPFSQVLGLNCPATEEITRTQYEVSIAAPIRLAFTKNGWWTVDRNADGNRYVSAATKRFMAIMRGVPLKIQRDPTLPTTPPPDAPSTPFVQKLFPENEASVDSELAAMFILDAVAPAVLTNSYYRSFLPILEVAPSQGPLLVCRLDASTDGIVRNMIDSAIETEKFGLWGWAYLDARNITSGNYKEGDDWIQQAGALMRRQGIPTILDMSPEIFPAGYPVTDAAVYYGWYTGDIAGPFAESDFKFVSGAIAVHLHSFSAQTLRSPTKGWSAPLLAHGAAATMGNVYEPYLTLTVDFSILQDRLMSGLTLAEAGYAAYRGLSWMGIVLGDPLYRPYASWTDMTANEAPNPWSKYRAAVLKAGGDPVAAAPELRKLADDTGNSMFLEALAQAQAVTGDFDGAVKTIEEALDLENRKSIRFRLTLEKIDFLYRGGEQAAARRTLSNAHTTYSGDEQAAILEKLSLQFQPKAEPTPDAAR